MTDNLYFEDLNIGDRFVTLRRTVTEADIVNFVALTGLYEPIFMDMEYLKEKSVIKKRFAPGLFTASVATGQVARMGLWYDTALAMLGLQCKFSKPLHPGDTIGVVIEVTGKKETSKPDKGVIDVLYSVTNQRGEKIAEVTETILMLRKGKGSPGAATKRGNRRSKNN